MAEFLPDPLPNLKFTFERLHPEDRSGQVDWHALHTSSAAENPHRCSEHMKWSSQTPGTGDDTQRTGLPGDVFLG